VDDEVKQARREREMCEDYLTANPRMYSCNILRAPIGLAQNEQPTYTSLLTCTHSLIKEPA